MPTTTYSKLFSSIKWGQTYLVTKSDMYCLGGGLFKYEMLP